MKTLTISLTEADVGKRLDKLVADSAGLSRAKTKRLFDERRVLSGRHVCDKGDLAVLGRTLTVELPDDDAEPALADPSVALVVLLETPDVVIVDKPAGMKTAPLRGGELGTLANGLVARYPEMGGIGYHAREPGLVHRLDNGTSGTVVAARTKAAWDTIVERTKANAVTKIYLAVVEDHDMPLEGMVDTPLAPHPKDKRRVLACLHPRDVVREKPRAAETRYKVLGHADGVALVAILAPRALRHQVRAHMEVLECPIVGDTLYGAKERAGLDRHALHAWQVSFPGGDGCAAFSAVSPFPAELSRLIPGVDPADSNAMLGQAFGLP